MVRIDGSTFTQVYDALAVEMAGADQVDQHRWQGVDVRDQPAARCYELRNVAFELDLNGEEDLDHWRKDIKPNLPWADAHFLERVGGQPLNPGKEWRNWPWGRSADQFRSHTAIFNHTYMERLWPRWARYTAGGVIDEKNQPVGDGHQGIGWRYGDLNDLVGLLVKDPFTRQGWIPLFHPEDTGWGDGGRKMCSLGYQFLRRGSGIGVWYPLRSCDLAHHWRDDCYLAVRLLLWVLQQCRTKDPAGWVGVGPSWYAMHMTSLHVFENDKRSL